jgi:thioredoxin reductase
MTREETCDVAIVGGGPAGAAAAVAAHSLGLSVCLIDEQPRLGGQIYRQPPAGFKVDSWLAGRVYAEGKALIARAQTLAGLRHIASATVCALFPGGQAGAAHGGHHLLFHDNERLGRVAARYVVLAAGCYELPVPFPGWHLPGVMSAGGIQTLLKSQRVAAGDNIMLAGSHPLLIVVAKQLLDAGIRVAGVAIAQPAWRVARLMKSPMAAWTTRGNFAHLLGCLAALRRARVPLLFGHAVVAALGKERLEAVCLRDLGGSSQERPVACDALGVCYGFAPSSELARQAGARHSWRAGGGWVVQADEFMRSSVEGLYVAGELTGVAGAEAAALSGEIAGVGVALAAGRVTASTAQQRTRHLRRRLVRIRRFAQVLAEWAQPSEALLAKLAQPTALLCRCEDVTVGQVAAALRADRSLQSASTVKLRTRVGMGPCQGRMCEFSVRRLVAEERGRRVEDVPGYVVRVPVKPLPIALLAGDPGALDIDPTRR